MAKIFDEGDNWHLVIAPNATQVKNIDEPSKGYSATLGEDPDTGRHVVMDVHYNKNKYSIDDVMKFIEKTRNCPQCAALDKERMNLESIELQEPTQSTRSRQVLGFKGAPTAIGSSQYDTQASVAQMNTTTPPPAPPQAPFALKDVFANIFFDAYLTTPGKYFLGLMLNDDRMLEAAIPKDPTKIPDFMDDMADFLSGKIEFTRSPDDVKEYLSVLRKDDGNGNTSASSTTAKNRKKRNSNATSVMIY